MLAFGINATGNETIPSCCALMQKPILPQQHHLPKPLPADLCQGEDDHGDQAQVAMHAQQWGNVEQSKTEAELKTEARLYAYIQEQGGYSSAMLLCYPSMQGRGTFRSHFTEPFSQPAQEPDCSKFIGKLQHQIDSQDQ